MGGMFRLNEPQVACEALEGDLILLNFESGLYFNIRGTGADICQHLLSGGSLETAVNELAARFGVPPAQVEEESSKFLEVLLREGLLMPCDAHSNGCPMKITAAAYATPQCEKFDDMADQLLLDKIEIDDENQDAQWARG
jgi:hypothetical protein